MMILSPLGQGVALRVQTGVEYTVAVTLYISHIDEDLGAPNKSALINAAVKVVSLE